MKAQMSIGREYDCKYDWGCFCQAGEHGVVSPLKVIIPQPSLRHSPKSRNVSFEEKGKQWKKPKKHVGKNIRKSSPAITRWNVAIAQTDTPTASIAIILLWSSNRKPSAVSVAFLPLMQKTREASIFARNAHIQYLVST